MNTKDWLYVRKSKIDNLKDLYREEEKIKLYQQFLGELISKDKQLMQKSLSPNNLANFAFSKVTGNSGTESGNVGSSVFESLITGNANSKTFTIFLGIGKWIYKKFFK